jgi:alpha-tubulin suppressor-like RCC1 family protein
MVWGTNAGGFLANGRREHECAITPVLVAGLSDVKKIVLGNSILVLKTDGTVWGWGTNGNGELCDGTTEPRYRPVQMKGIANAVDIDIDQVSAVVLADGTVWRCGVNVHSQMAKKNEPESVKYMTPQQIPGITTAVAVRTAGATFARLKDGTVLGWGSGIFGSLGNGRYDGIFPKPTPPVGLGAVLEHYVASGYSYAIKADGTMMAWGGDQSRIKPIVWRKLKLAE